MSSDDEKDFIMCEYCEDQRDLCDRNFLVDDRRFSIKLDETFEVDTCIPCHARIFVLDKIGFSAMETMEVKRVYLKTEHGYTFNVKLYNADTYTYFECKTWQALCKAYAFEPDMVITFDIRPEDDIEGNRDIWVDVQMPPVLPLYRTYYCPGAELNCEEISHYVSWLEDLHTVKTNFLPALRNVSTQNVRPIVIVLNYGHIYLRKMGLPMTVVPQWIETKGHMSMVILRPRYPTFHMSAFRISKSDECLIVKDWSKIVNDPREVLGGSNEKRSPRLGDRFICMLQYDESGELYMFYAILPAREQQE
ncbi:unnamed protein product [Triticum aestivum]|uniref:Uncharacterized protein n=1 Tax=Triticum aestivum TaxID=4565 RepID=A0A7H4LMT7_WHEAT|nr:unnamed protein product [Triticum aestivum]